MAVFTDLTQARIISQTKRLYGTVLTRPTLAYSATSNDLTYACDVNVSETDPTGKISQLIKVKGGKGPDLGGLPGQPPPYWNLGDEREVSTVMRNVTIARGNQELIYADIGTAVELTKTQSGKWEVTGFSIERPGTYILIPVSIPELTFGPIEFPPPITPPITIHPPFNGSVETRQLTFGELGEYEPFGALPFGASAIFVGGRLAGIA
jgi:hypothetical protein